MWFGRPGRPAAASGDRATGAGGVGERDRSTEASPRVGGRRERLHRDRQTDQVGRVRHRQQDVEAPFALREADPPGEGGRRVEQQGAEGRRHAAGQRVGDQDRRVAGRGRDRDAADLADARLRRRPDARLHHGLFLRDDERIREHVGADAALDGARVDVEEVLEEAGADVQRALVVRRLAGEDVEAHVRRRGVEAVEHLHAPRRLRLVAVR
ncbi:MAG: hypothetical protein ACK595_16350, partial [Planctomycetota bacterium]